MDLNLAKSATSAEVMLQFAQERHNRAHDALAAELRKHGYAATDAMMKRAKQAADGDEGSVKRSYKIGSGLTPHKLQWMWDDDVDDCDNHACFNDEQCGGFMNVFTDEHYCDTCFNDGLARNVVLPPLSDIVSNESEIVPPANTVAFEWRRLGPRTGSLKCALCNAAPVYQFIGSKYIVCKNHYPH